MRVSVPTARYDTPEKVVELLSAADRARARAARRAVSGRRARAAAGDDDRRLRSRRRGLRGSARARTRRAIGRSSSDGAFEAMGTRLMRGRWFTRGRHDASRSRSPSINETMARTYWKDPDDAVGGRIRVGGMTQPVGHRRRHRRRRAAQRRHRHREGEVLRAAQPVARRHRRQPHPQRVRRRAHGGRSAGAGRRRCAREIRATRSEPSGREHPSDDGSRRRRRWRRRG